MWQSQMNTRLFLTDGRRSHHTRGCPLWAQSDHLLHYVRTSALENSGRSDTMRHGSRPGNTSLFALTNSLILGRNFPVKKFREIAPKSLFSLPRSRQQARIPAKPAVFPCTFPVYREFWCRLASSKLSAQPTTSQK